MLGLLTEKNIDRLDGMKIDIEGHEEAVLIPFLEQAPENLLPQLIVIENNYMKWKRDLLALAKTRGYVSKTITRMNVILEKFNREILIMTETSEKIGRAALYLLLLAGPVLGTCNQGVCSLNGNIRFHGFYCRSDATGKVKQVELRKFIFALPFLFFMGLSLLWSQAENAGSSYFVLILVVLFTACLRISFKGLSLEEQDKFKHLLSASLLFGIIVSISIGSYPLFWPELSILINNVSNQLTFANIELLRQSNRSLSLIPVFLFPLAGFYWNRAKWLFIPLIAITFFITANSNSQTAFLAMLLGTIAFVFAIFLQI